MTPQEAQSGPWSLSAESFARLLAALSPEPNHAAERYENLRLRLTRFFSWERCSFPEDRADEALNRLARRLDQGESVQNPESYAYGVARLMVKEAAAEGIRRDRAFNRWKDEKLQPPDPPADATAPACLKRCLATLDDEQRTFVLEYYTGDSAARIEQRKRMAARSGIALNALRNRALRLRGKLEGCMHSCLKNGA